MGSPFPSYALLIGLLLFTLASWKTGTSLIFSSALPTELLDISASPSSEAPKNYFYVLFKSKALVPPQTDGKSGTGVMCRPGSQVAVMSTDQLILSDMCGGGSAIRLVNWDGIHTIAGSGTESGYVDGNRTEARFGSFSQGSQQANGLCLVGNLIFFADTSNNVIRRVSPETGATNTYISQVSQLEGLSLSYPGSVSPYQHFSNSTNLFISDTGNMRILFSPIVDEAIPPLTLVRQGFQPGVITVSSNLESLFYVMNMDEISGLQLETNNPWSIGQSNCSGYISSLALSDNNSQLLFFGEQNSVTGVYTFSTNSTVSINPKPSIEQTCGELQFTWPYTENARSIAARNAYSYYIVTNTAVYIASERELYFPPINATDNRTNVLIGYPVPALPVESDCLMSAFYAALMEDIEESFETTNYYIQFAPYTDRSLLVNGTMNVSNWCEMLREYEKSKDGTVLIMNVYGPLNWTSTKILDNIRKSGFSNARDYLDTLYKSGEGSIAPDGSQYPFCLLPCDGDACINYSVSGQYYCTFRAGCDRFCIAGIISGGSMGITLIALVVLVILIPSNLFNAFFMVPII